MEEITLEILVNRILCADKNELNSIIDAAAERFSEIWPDHELMTVTVSGHCREDHIKALQDSISLLSQMQ